MPTKKGSKKAGGSRAGALSTSGPTQQDQRVTRASATVKKEDVASLGALWTYFGRQVPDASPGWNVLTLTLPAGTRNICVWMTEWAAGNVSHAGGAWFYTYSVQLYANGSRCRVRWYMDWNTFLPAGFNIIAA